jgi:hypothetical protein
MTRDLVAARNKYSYLTSTTAIVTNSTTYTNFPISLSLGVGTWKADWCVTASSTTIGGGYKYQLAFDTGTATLGAVETLYAESSSTSSVLYNTTIQLPFENASAFPLVVRTQNTSGAFYNKGTAIIVVTVAGTFTIQAAQNTASAGVTLNARSGCFMTATQIS